MARQARLILPTLAHLVSQAGHNGQAIVHDALDAQYWLDIVCDVAATHRVALHGWCLTETSYRLLASPDDAVGLGRMLQDLGRRYVGRFNARYGRSGTLWDGRFRCAAVEPGEPTLLALLYVERGPAGPIGRCSLGHHLGTETVPWLKDPSAYWALGNTPFDRHVAWKERVEHDLVRSDLLAIERCLRSGTPYGRAAWLQHLQTQTARALFPRPRGRPRKSATA